VRVQSRIRRIGNSLGIVIPIDEIKRHGITEGDIVEIEIERKVNLKEMFGSLKFSKGTQQMKDEARAGWGE
jgi:antitoxin component of MazEF toxin-antitoxin module